MKNLRRSAVLFLFPVGLFCAGSGSLFGQALVYTGSTAALNLGSANVCPFGHATPAPCSKAVTLQYKATASVTISTVGVLTAGAANQDFTLGAGSTSGGEKRRKPPSPEDDRIAFSGEQVDLTT